MARPRKEERDLVQPSRRQRVPPVKLDTVGHVLHEMQALYRMARVGNLHPDDMGRMIFALREIRVTLEAATPVIEQSGPAFTVNVVSVPSGQHIGPAGELVSCDEARELWAAHHAQRQQRQLAPPDTRPTLKVINGDDAAEPEPPEPEPEPPPDAA